MDSFESMLYGIFNSANFHRDRVGNDKVGKYTIDTCDACGQGYETALWDDREYIIIVERYPDREAAEVGHVKWCKYCESNPEGAYSVQLDKYEYFDETKNEWGF